LGADEEHAREAAEKEAARPAGQLASETARRRSLELSLARVDDLLRKTESEPRRQALETARAELLERLEDGAPAR
jgi:hypothetical protein